MSEPADRRRAARADPELSPMTNPLKLIERIILETTPLPHARGRRLPLILWWAWAVDVDDRRLERILLDLDARGIGLFSILETGAKAAASRTLALRVGVLQKKLGLNVNVFCNAPLHGFCNGDEETAHIDADGQPFFDTSFGEQQMGCPFTLHSRCAAVREQIDFHIRAYEEQQVAIDFIFADWEIDGPIEWNDAWEHSKRCRRCRQHIGDIEDFSAFQTALRTIRSDLQKRTLADAVLSRFPEALVGNYAVTPHTGYRCWIDFFEREDYPPAVPVRSEGRARYRLWAHEFEGTDYTMAMPVVYTWARCFRWYDFEDSDWRWFYNMLLVATNACRGRHGRVPIVCFVHHKTIWVPGKPAADVAQFGTGKYRELLWHMLLRGCDGFALWCRDSEIAFEVKPLQQVYAEALTYRDFLESGEPLTYELPQRPGPVVSGLRLGDRLLVRRTDFSETAEPVTVPLGSAAVEIPRNEGACQILPLP